MGKQGLEGEPGQILEAEAVAAAWRVFEIAELKEVETYSQAGGGARTPQTEDKGHARNHRRHQKEDAHSREGVARAKGTGKTAVCCGENRTVVRQKRRRAQESGLGLQGTLDLVRTKHPDHGKTGHFKKTIRGGNDLLGTLQNRHQEEGKRRETKGNGKEQQSWGKEKGAVAVVGHELRIEELRKRLARKGEINA